MRKKAIFTLVKDVVIAVLACFLITFILGEGGIDIFKGQTNPYNCFFIGLLVAGIPFGWRWASKLFSAISARGILIKLVFALLLGWVAIFVVIIGDIIRCFTASSEKTTE